MPLRRKVTTLHKICTKYIRNLIEESGYQSLYQSISGTLIDFEEESFTDLLEDIFDSEYSDSEDNIIEQQQKWRKKLKTGLKFESRQPITLPSKLCQDILNFGPSEKELLMHFIFLHHDAKSVSCRCLENLFKDEHCIGKICSILLCVLIFSRNCALEKLTINCDSILHGGKYLKVCGEKLTYLELCQANDVVLYTIASYACKLKTLIINCGKLIDRHGIEILCGADKYRGCKDLEVLKLNAAKLKVAEFKIILAYLHELRVLHLTNIRTFTDIYLVMYEFNENCVYEKIEELDVPFPVNISRHFPNLKILNANIGENYAIEYFDSLDNLINLTSLSISLGSMDANSHGTFQRVLANIGQNITTLFMHSDMEYECHIGHMMTSCPNLEEFSISSTLAKVDFMENFEADTNLKKLYLDVKCNGSCVQNLLEFSPNLEEIFLNIEELQNCCPVLENSIAKHGFKYLTKLIIKGRCSTCVYISDIIETLIIKEDQPLRKIEMLKYSQELFSLLDYFKENNYDLEIKIDKRLCNLPKTPAKKLKRLKFLDKKCTLL